MQRVFCFWCQVELCTLSQIWHWLWLFARRQSGDMEGLTLEYRRRAKDRWLKGGCGFRAEGESSFFPNPSSSFSHSTLWNHMEPYGIQLIILCLLLLNAWRHLFVCSLQKASLPLSKSWKLPRYSSLQSCLLRVTYVLGKARLEGISAVLIWLKVRAAHS